MTKIGWTLPIKVLLRRWMLISFIIMVLIPSVSTVLYYALIASPVYVSSAQFAVRGINNVEASFSSLATVLGSSAQSYDSYIIVDYVQSPQMIRDVAAMGTDLRLFYTKSNIDFVERIHPDMPLEYFVDYWNRKIDVAFNSTTGNIVLTVRAYSPEDAHEIAAAVLTAAERLVTQLSSNARNQLITAAEEEVINTQERLADVRLELQRFRDEQQAVDAEQLAQVEQTVIAELESQLSDLETRRATVVATLAPDSPTVRVLDQQIAAVQQQLEERRARVGAGVGNSEVGDSSRLSSIVNQFRELSMRQEYAETAYTQALGSLETAIVDARQQDRYFAVFETPNVPEVATEPNKVFFSLLFSAAFAIVWGVTTLIVGAVREHVI